MYVVSIVGASGTLTADVNEINSQNALHKVNENEIAGIIGRFIQIRFPWNSIPDESIKVVIILNAYSLFHFLIFSRPLLLAVILQAAS